MKKRVIIMTISYEVGKFYKKILEDLFDELIEFHTYSFEKESFNNMISADLYLLGTTSSDISEYVKSFIPKSADVADLDITFTKESISLLSGFPKGTKAMLVNLSSNMAIETLSDLIQLGVHNIEFTPYYPGSEFVPDLDLAITSGESRFTPDRAKTIIDIGHRVISASTIIEIAFKLGFSNFFESEKFKNYISCLAVSDYSLDKLATRTSNVENRFDFLLETLDVGIIGIDTSNVVFAFNTAAENILGIKSEGVVGKPVDISLSCMPVNIFKAPADNTESQLIRVKGVLLSIKITPIVQRGVYVGYFATIQRFSDEENRQQKLRLQLLDRGYTSKYCFDDIIGKSHCLVKAKEIARKMSMTDASILLIGESGTGKELFAHSIHNSSSRRNNPFVAINCAALPDSLLESELFGYAEGSFTGAKKGGKLGLFEHAHRGTLFLDEIEGMSPNLQVKLLRVLQEKEIMRIGEDKIITIDVRIVAASNEDIKRMVENGTFRKDLYYRLNTLPIDIPPLRERGDDIFLLIKSLQKKIGSNFVLTERSKQVFLNYRWDGNVRELRNIVEYLTYMDRQTIDYEDLPDVLKEPTSSTVQAVASKATENCGEFDLISSARREDYVFVMNQLIEAWNNGKNLGRKSISDAAAKNNLHISEQEARKILNDLSSIGYVSIGRGRGGCKLTTKGRTSFLR